MQISLIAVVERHSTLCFFPLVLCFSELLMAKHLVLHDQVLHALVCLTLCVLLLVVSHLLGHMIGHSSERLQVGWKHWCHRLQELSLHDVCEKATASLHRVWVHARTGMRKLLAHVENVYFTEDYDHTKDL